MDEITRGVCLRILEWIRVSKGYDLIRTLEMFHREMYESFGGACLNFF